MTLEQIKQDIEKLPKHEFFELARRLSARYPELSKERVFCDSGRGKFDPAFAERDEQLKRGEVRPL